MYVAFGIVSQNDRCMSRGMTPRTRPAARRIARIGRRRCACGSCCEVAVEAGRLASPVASMMSTAEGQSSDGDEKET